MTTSTRTVPPAVVRRRRGRGFTSAAAIALVGIVAPVCAAVVATAADPAAPLPMSDAEVLEPAVRLPEQADEPGTAAEETTRQQLEQYFDELQTVVDSQAAGPGSPATDMSAAVAVARSLIDELGGAELRAMGDVIAANPNWSEQPAVLQDAVGASPADSTPSAGPNDILPNDILMEYSAPESLMSLSFDGASESVQSAARDARAALAPRSAAALFVAGDPEGFLSNCQGANGDVRGLFYGYWVAAQVAGAAGAVASGIPTSVEYGALTIISGIAFGVANGIAIGLDYALGRAQDCESAKSNAALTSTYPTDPSAVTPTNPAGYTPASTQTSVTQLTTIVGGIQQTLTIIDGATVSILEDQLLVINGVGVAQNSANQIQATTEDSQFRADDLRANIGSPIDVANEIDNGVVCVADEAPAGSPTPPPANPPCNTANGLANTLDVRLDTLLAETADFEALSLRLVIERTLADPSQKAIGLFVLPTAQGGYLELVADIVTMTLVSEVAAGQGIGDAESFLAAANEARAAGDHAGAYDNYAKAYRAAVK